MYLAWTQEGSISLYTFLNYAISQNWIDTSNLQKDAYSTSDELYKAVMD